MRHFARPPRRDEASRNYFSHLTAATSDVEAACETRCELTYEGVIGAPLYTPDGHHLGSLCVFDQQPRHYTQEQIDTLADLADLTDLIRHEIELRAATRRAALGT